ncbi:MAG: flavodoxin family protein [Clostridiaceae bacterium]
MKTIVLFSSPDRNGNTGTLLDSFLKNCSSEVEIINIYSLKINPCIDCKFCQKNRKCVFADDMNAIYEKIESCDALIIASPMYFTSFPAPLKMVIDRFQVYWSRKFILKEESPFKRKKAILIMSSGLRGIPAFSHCEAMMKQFFSLINAEAYQPLYAEETDRNPVRSDENQKILAIKRGEEFCN